jgi:rubrerythrin
MAECNYREGTALETLTVVEERHKEVLREIYDEHPFRQQTEEERAKLKIATLQKLEVVFPQANIRVLEADLTLGFSEHSIDFIFSDEVGYEELMRAVKREAHRG